LLIHQVDNLSQIIFEQLPYVAAGIVVLAFFWLISKIFQSAFWAASSRCETR
jgi:hypothetical protein